MPTRTSAVDVEPTVLAEPLEAGEDALSALTSALLERLDDHADRAVRRTLSSVPGLAEGVERDDLWAATLASMRTSLTLLATGTAVNAADLPTWRALGERRARQGVVLDDVMQALRIANSVLWEAMTTAAVQSGSECAQQVLAQAALVWNNFDQICSAISEGHQDVDAAHCIHLRRRALGLLAALRRLPQDAAEAEQLARALGLDPNASFVAVVHSPDDSLDFGDASMVKIEQPGRTLVLVQCSASPPLGELAVMRSLDAATGPVGVGIHRDGLDGARQSTMDAEMAFRAAVSLRESRVSFREHWLACLTLEHRDQQEVLVEDAVRHLQQDEPVRETLRIYLAQDGSLSAAGDALGLHANTIAYRLRQFADRTGVDARTAEGAALVQVALTLAQADSHGWHTVPATTLAAS